MLWLVFEIAKQDRLSYIDAVSNVPKYVQSARKDLKDIEDLQNKIFGKSNSKMESGEIVNILDIKKLKKMMV